MNEPISLYVPEDLEVEMRQAGLLQFSWGHGISTAILWTARHCEDIEDVLRQHHAEQRTRRALVPSRRTSAMISSGAHALLRAMTGSEHKTSTAVKAIVRYFIAHCEDIHATLMETSTPLDRPRSISALSIRFDYDTAMRIRDLSERASCSEGEFVVALVRDALAP